jgi:hypothetical protein
MQTIKNKAIKECKKRKCRNAASQLTKINFCHYPTHPPGDG